MAIPAAGDLPFFGDLRDLALGPLDGAPEWLRSLAWAAVAFGTLLGLATLAVRLGFPLLARLLPQPTAALIDRVGVALVFPEFLVTTLVRRMGWRLPRGLISYGDAVHEGVLAGEALARASLRRLGRLRTLPLATIVIALVALTATWNWTYCAGRDPSCRTPTSEWADSVSEPTPSR